MRISDYTRQLASLPLKASIVVLDAARQQPFIQGGEPIVDAGRPERGAEQVRLDLEAADEETDNSYGIAAGRMKAGSTGVIPQLRAEPVADSPRPSAG